MSGEEQERFEDYLELERYIEQLRLDQSAHPPTNLTPQQMRIYRMAMLFHSASPHVADPRPEFTVQLQQRLLEQMQMDEVETAREEALSQQAPQLPVEIESQVVEQQENGEKELTPLLLPVQLPSSQPENAEVKRHKARRVSRRALLTGGTVAAASLLAGAGIEHAITEPQTTPPVSPAYQYPPLVGNVPVAWHLVAPVEQLGKDALRFNTDTVVGYVMRQTDQTDYSQGSGAGSSPTEQIVAFSAACTHMGCIVHWQASKRQFLCPCHNGAFDDQGNPVATAHPLYLTSLPRLETKVEDGNIYVKVALPPT